MRILEMVLAVGREDHVRNNSRFYSIVKNFGSDPGTLER